MRSVNLATFRRHRGDAVIRNMRGRAVISGRPTINNLHLKTNWKRDSLVVFLSRWNEASLGSGSWRTWVFGSDADWQSEGCVGGWRRLVVLSVVVMAQRMSHGGGRGRSIFGLVNRLADTCGSVSSVKIHSAGAQTPALPEITASPSLAQRHKIHNVQN